MPTPSMFLRDVPRKRPAPRVMATAERPPMPSPLSTGGMGPNSRSIVKRHRHAEGWTGYFLHAAASDRAPWRERAHVPSDIALTAVTLRSEGRRTRDRRARLIREHLAKARRREASRRGPYKGLGPARGERPRMRAELMGLKGPASSGFCGGETDLKNRDEPTRVRSPVGPTRRSVRAPRLPRFSGDPRACAEGRGKH